MDGILQMHIVAMKSDLWISRSIQEAQRSARKMKEERMRWKRRRERDRRYWVSLAAACYGASAKSHAGKQVAGSQGGSQGGAGDKVNQEKEQTTTTEPAEGGGDDASKGVVRGGGGGAGGGGGGGGGGKRPGRPPKLPQCCLPNNMQPTFYIGGGNGTALVEGPLLGLGWKRITDKNDERYKLKWVENKSRINYVAFREGEQLVNHIPNCKLLTNKLGLLCSLQEYERVTLLTKGRTPRMKMTDFIPETYKLDERLDREKFLAEYADGETWICKPTSLNQGKGIFLLRSREEINNLLSEREAKLQSKSFSRQPLMRIVQRYINKPMLLDNRKFDIRSYMMIASTVPYLVVFHQGYVRLSCQKYDQADTNLTTHLTNQFVQKKDPMYKDYKEDTAWTMDKFNDYINDHVAKEKGLDKDWVYGYLTRQMQRISLHCFNSVKHKLQCKIGYFDLYGLDFMVDDDMKVWLIEINANPALHTNCSALKDAIPPVVENGLYLALECFDKSRKGQPLMPLNSLSDFSVLYCGASPNAVAPRQIRSVSPFKDAGDWGSRPAGTSSSTRRHSPPRNLPRMNTTASTVATSSSGATQGQTTSVTTTTPASSTSQGPLVVTKPERREPPSSILPTINIGTSLAPKSSSAGAVGGTSSNSTSRQQHQQQQHHHHHQQQQQQQQQREATLTRVSLTGGVSSSTNDDLHRLRMIHADNSAPVRKSRDNPLRGN
ncbi:protein polyglycylase ttll10-like isoform x1 [Plakobranchus ocellatus]|uniref:Protein polyglycylase ttll10-like isoform x1 n=1 Tax=Plakobranchus ocellatus TaxID=259542 RepID=A0AAV4BRT2_9GAST|nr:protein polyglycylase ttll10-like isoform x1 [Plakobranchus ocellatus]